MTHELLARLRQALAAAGDPKRAAAKQAYMKSVMAFHGVAMGPTRKIAAAVIRGWPVESRETWEGDTRALWDGAEFREEWYCAIAFTGDRRARSYQTLATLPIYEHMIVIGAWWDVVDEVADHRVGPILKADPSTVGPIMRSWSRSDDMWKRRASIICQTSFKESTDLDLLYDCIRPSMGSREFFLRKAIGWALRQYAWTDADEIIRFVRVHKDELSPLSKREALKNASGPSAD